MIAHRIRLVEDLPDARRPRSFRCVLECGHECRVAWSRRDIVDAFRDRTLVHCWDCDHDHHRQLRARAVLERLALPDGSLVSEYGCTRCGLMVWHHPGASSWEVLCDDCRLASASQKPETD